MSETCFDSPALKEQSKIYPKQWKGKVPKRIRTTRRVTADFPFLVSDKSLVCEASNEYDCWVNRNGAVSAILANGKQLGLRPGEFEIIEWHEAQS